MNDDLDLAIDGDEPAGYKCEKCDETFDKSAKLRNFWKVNSKFAPNCILLLHSSLAPLYSSLDYTTVPRGQSPSDLSC